MEASQRVDLHGFVGRDVAEVVSALKERNVDVETQAVAAPGPLAMLFGALPPPPVPAGSRVRALTVGTRVVRFTVDADEPLRLALAARDARIEALEQRLAALEQRVQNLQGGGTGTQPPGGRRPRTRSRE
jgi:hypothetical protein